MRRAAFALASEHGERLVVVHQLDRQFRGSDHQEIIQAIRRCMLAQLELAPYAIVLSRQTSLPITSSGKVQRNLCREQYVAGELKVVHAWTTPAAPPVAAGREDASGRVDVEVHEDGVVMRQSKEPGPVQR